MKVAVSLLHTLLQELRHQWERRVVVATIPKQRDVIGKKICAIGLDQINKAEGFATWEVYFSSLL